MAGRGGGGPRRGGRGTGWAVCGTSHARKRRRRPGRGWTPPVTSRRPDDVVRRGGSRGAQMTATELPPGRLARMGGGIVGALVLVEFTSGVLQGYYTPLLTDVARHLGVSDADVNWLEAGQLMLSAIAVPVLAKLGDLYGHRRMLLVAAALTAVGSLLLPVVTSFPLFLAAWAVQGLYSAWLPLEVALLHNRSRRLADP